MATNSAGVNFGKPNEDFIIESDGSGTIISARNAVTGDEFIGGGGFEQYSGTMTITKNHSSTLYMVYALIGSDGDINSFKYTDHSFNNATPRTFTGVAALNGDTIILGIQRGDIAIDNAVNCEVTVNIIDPSNSNLLVKPTSLTADCSFTIKQA